VLAREAIVHRPVAVAFAVMMLAVVTSRLNAAQAQQAEAANWKAQFLTLCDLAVAELNKPVTPFKESHRTTEDATTHHVPFFEDSYGVRALLVAYDLTGDRKYLDACTRWADHVVALQQRMTPRGAYYVNYEAGRAVDQDKGDWWLADSSSVAMAILATAVRTQDVQRRARYLASTRSFSRLVIDNYVGKDGGITDGIWSSFAGEWWCSTAIFGAFAYLSYGEKHDPEYLKVALAATDWLNRHNLNKPQPPAFEPLGPGVVFYTLEFYTVALPYLEAGTPRRQAAETEIGVALDWLAKNQQGRGAQNSLDYLDSATYMSGMPYLMYIFAGALPQYRDQAAEGDKELQYIHALLFKNGEPHTTRLQVWEFMTWAMLSYAERVSPGSARRSSQVAVVR